MILNYIHYNELHHYLVGENTTIRDALNLMQQTQAKFVIVNDQNGNFSGILLEGDIRRALLKNANIDKSIKPYFNKTPKVLSREISFSEAEHFLRKNGINFIPIVQNRKCTGVFIELPKNLFEQTAILMLGGTGSRLMPLTKDTPKPLLILNDGTILDHILEKLNNYGFKNVIMCLNYLADQFIEKYQSNIWNMNISFVTEKDKLGTAGALSLIDQITTTGNTLVMNGDIISDIHLNDLFYYHIKNNSDATMAVFEDDFHIPFGVVEAYNNNFIKCVEKPVLKKLINMGIYVLNNEIIGQIEKESYLDMPDLFQQLNTSNFNTKIYKHNGIWHDLGTLEQYNKVKNLNLRAFI